MLDTGNTDGDTKPADGDTKPADGDTKTQVELLTKAVGLMAAGMEEIKTQNKSLSDAVTQLAANSKPKEEPAPSLDEILEKADIEHMDKAGLVKFLAEHVGKVVEEKVAVVKKEANDRVSTLEATFHGANANAAVKEVATANKDFFEWAPEMRILVAENPSLTIQRAYTLAKAENPKKAAEMTKKYAPPPSDTTGRRFGLTPTSTGKEGSGKMSQKEASLKAFDEVMGDLGTVNSDRQVI